MGHEPLTAYKEHVIADILTQDDLTWVDVVNPTSEDTAELEQRFHFHRLALEDVTHKHQRPKLDEYPGYSYVVLYAIRPHSAHRHASTSELQFFWSRTVLVTIHPQPFPEVDDLINRARSGALPPIVDAANRHLEIADIVYRILDGVVDGYFPAVDALAEWTDDIEEQMFAGQRRPQTLQTIFALRKGLINVRKVVAPGREVINGMLRHDQALFDDIYYPYFQDVYDHTVRVIDSLDTYRDLLGTALDTYVSIVSNDVNQTVKTMTAVTAILMVDALIPAIYGMNFKYIPELDWPLGYPYSLLLMLAATLLLLLIFRRIRWL